MSSIEGLKEKARRHEQKEEWQKALDLYAQAIDRLDDADEPDISLFNRVGDLNTRIGRSDDAVEHYERAVELYMDAELPNNAIAVCKKIIRNVPNRHSVYLRMGQIRAEQGFLVDARNSFLTYAERVQGDGDIEEALRALVEFADLAPEDTEIRMAIAAQYAANDQPDEAIEQLAFGWTVLVEKGDTEAAAAFEAQASEIDPSVDLSSVDVGRPAASEEPVIEEFGFESTALDGEDYATDDDVSAFGDDAFADADPLVDDAASSAEVGDAEGTPSGIMETAAEEAADTIGAIAEDDDDLGTDLPLMSFEGDEDGGDALAERAPVTEGMADFNLDDFGGDDVTEAQEDDSLGGDLPLLSFDDDEDDAEDAAPLDEEYGVADAAGLEELDEDDEVVASGLDDALEGAFEESSADDAFGDELGVGELSAVPGDDHGSTSGVPAAETADPVEEEPVEEDPRELFERLAADATASPADVAVPQRMVEVAFRIGDDATTVRAYLALAGALKANGNSTKAKGVLQQVLALDPDNVEANAGLEAAGGTRRTVQEVAASEDYVDLGSLILGDEEEKTTRFTVAYEEPSGDEAEDFKKMLSQFKAKVAENFDASDVKAHHDLGTAYKEMGLLDEAIEEFQQALRASADHLATYELLGQVFMEKGEIEAAINVLNRAIETEWKVEDDLIGIYYYLGRAHQDRGNDDRAVEFYDKVFALDINFADVTERLRTLR